MALAGCLGIGNAYDVTRSDPAAFGLVPVARSAALDATMEDGSTSALIEGLLNRASVLEPGPLRQIADAVMAANARAAEAELRAAMLRSRAAASNWLPRLGPNVSLTSLGSVVRSLVLDQAILDHGVRAAERDFARADVEVAAVSLAEDSNARVLAALELYLRAEAARARAAISAAGLAEMERYSWIMTERVNAGVSDRADLQVVAQRQNQLLADLAADRELAVTALAELQAMAASPLDAVTGLSGIAAPSPTAQALAVMRAEAEGRRAIAAARATRAGFLPGLSASGDLMGDGIGLRVAVPNGVGLGSGAAVAAAEAESDAVQALRVQVREQAARDIAALQGRLTALRRQEAEAQALARAAADNYLLFAAQQRAGQRAVPETVGVFETRLRAERVAAEMAYEIAVVELRIAAQLGALVDGEAI